MPLGEGGQDEGVGGRHQPRHLGWGTTGLTSSATPSARARLFEPRPLRAGSRPA